MKNKTTEEIIELLEKKREFLTSGDKDGMFRLGFNKAIDEAIKVLKSSETK